MSKATRDFSCFDSCEDMSAERLFHKNEWRIRFGKRTLGTITLDIHRELVKIWTDVTAEKLWSEAERLADEVYEALRNGSV